MLLRKSPAGVAAGHWQLNNPNVCLPTAWLHMHTHTPSKSSSKLWGPTSLCKWNTYFGPHYRACAETHTFALCMYNILALKKVFIPSPSTHFHLWSLIITRFLCFYWFFFFNLWKIWLSLTVTLFFKLFIYFFLYQTSSWLNHLWTASLQSHKCQCHRTAKTVENPLVCRETPPPSKF